MDAKFAHRFLNDEQTKNCVSVYTELKEHVTGDLEFIETGVGTVSMIRFSSKC